MQHIALTGATSMLGIATIKECINKKISVLAFCRANSKNLNRIHRNDLVTIIECDLDSMNNFDCKELKADVFYHFGWAYTDKDGRNDTLKQATNIQYTLDAVHLAQTLGCKKFIMAGSQAEYGVTNETLSAATPCNPLVSYGVAKYAAGKLSRIECEKVGMEYIGLRILSVYGKNDGANTLISQLLYNAKNNIPMGLSGCEQIWDYLYEEDAGRAFVAVGEHGMNGKTYMIGSGIGKPLREYVETLIKIVNSAYKPEYGKFSYSPTQPMYLVADISELISDTGWKPEVSFEEGIKAILENTPPLQYTILCNITIYRHNIFAAVKNDKPLLQEAA